MGTEEAKLKHSKRIHTKQTAIEKQVKIAREYGIPVKEPHKYAKHNAMNCGNPDCAMCGNPRKTFKQETIQEKRFKQTKIDLL